MDLRTLYYVTAAALLVAVIQTLREFGRRQGRSIELGFWTLGYALLGTGCFLVVQRGKMADPIAYSLANTLMVTGYCALAAGIAKLDGNRVRPWIAFLPTPVTALFWYLFGASFPADMWFYTSAVFICVPCLGAAAVLWWARTIRPLRSWLPAFLIFGGHGVFYALRALVLPFLENAYGETVLENSSVVTMFEGTLVAFVLPSILLSLLREETEAELLAMSRTDYLTGLDNRRALFDKAHQRSRRRAGDAVLVFDLDHFKRINDRHGHETGDEILKLFARIARTELRALDVLARMGGEEFAALLPGQTENEANEVAERIARRFDSEAPGLLGDPAARASVSVGIAVAAPGTSVALPDLLAAADRALYRAKRLGRNRIEREKLAA